MIEIQCIITQRLGLVLPIAGAFLHRTQNEELTRRAFIGGARDLYCAKSKRFIPLVF